MNDASLYLVTGAGGFVGMQLVNELRAHNYPVRALIRQPAQADALRALGAEPFVGDLCNPDAMQQAMQGVKGVFHIAALFRQADQPDAAYHAVNVEGVRRVLEAARHAGVQRVIHCSTVGVLGHIEQPPADEHTPYQPGDIYQVTKMEGEKVALDTFRSGAMKGVVLRPAMIYGPGDTRTLKMFRMIARRRFFYVGRGDNLVHFIDVRDLARAFRLAMEHTERNGEVYIIAGARALPLRELAEATAALLGVKPPWLKIPVKPMQWLGSLCEAICVPLRINPPIYRRRVDFFTKDRSFDAAKARRELGFEPAQTPEAEWKDIVTDYQTRGWLG